MAEQPELGRPKEPSDSFKLSDEQSDTAKLLDSVFGKSIADRYIDFCRLSAGFFDLRVSSPIAAHALRELDSILRETLAAPMGAKIEGTVSPKKAKEIRKALKALGYDLPAIDRAIKQLAPKTNHIYQIKKIITRLGLPDDGDVAKAWISVSRASGKAHERRFDRALKVDDEFRTDWARPFDNVVRGIAVALQGRYTLLMKRVETLAAMDDKGKAVALYEREIPGALPLQWHFFRSLRDPEWLPYLIENKLIVEPQSRANEDNDGGIRFRDWPIGSYLLEMAKSGSAETRTLVANALRSLANTENPDVRRDGIEILAVLPADEAAELVDIAEGWLSRESFFLGPHHAEKLLKTLAEAQQRDATFRLAKALLRLFERNGRLATLYSRHMYEHSLPKTTSVITKALGLDALELLTDLLYQAALLSDKIRTNPPGDYTSVILQPLPLNESAAYDVFGALVVAVNRCAEYLVEQPGTDVAVVISILTKQKFKIFKRLALHVLARKPNAAPDAAERFLFDIQSLDSISLRFEYAELAMAYFPELSAEKQAALMSLVDSLPSKHALAWRERFIEHTKREPNADDEQKYKAAMIRDATWHWRSVLAQERQDALNKIVAEIGDPDAWKNRFDAEADKSPMSAADFSVKSAEDIAGYLRNWSPGANPKETKTALGMELYKAVQGDPQKFSAGATFFADLAPLYVRRLFEGLRNSVQNKGRIEWQPVLQLFEKVAPLAEPPQPGKLSSGGDDPSWFWAVKEGAQLLRSGLMQGREGIEYRNAAHVSRIISNVEKAAPKSVEIDNFEELYRQTPYFAAENTMLGLATELRVLELFWLSKHEGSAPFANPKEAIETHALFADFAQRVLMETGINGRVIRAIFGRYLSWLAYFGLPWVKANIDKLFPPSSEELREATWLAHLINDQGPIVQLMVELAPSYWIEINHLTEDRPEGEKDWRHDRLGEYVIVQYLWGNLPAELLEAFCDKAPSQLRQHVMWFIGHDLKRSPNQMPPEIRTRALAYWDKRLSAAEDAKNKDPYRSELGSIGTWLQNSALDTQWLIDQQLRMLRAGFVPNQAYSVVEWTFEIANEHPDGAVALVEELFKNPKTDQWAYTTQQSAVRSILTAGLASSHADTHAAVERIISFLASRGETSFLDLSQNP